MEINNIDLYKQKSNRNDFIDLVKSFSIVLMILGHCIQYGSGSYYLENECYFNNLVFKIIYSFHMPLFALVSGYLLFFSYSKRNLKDSLLRKAQQLIIPLMTWALIDTLKFFINESYFDFVAFFIKYLHCFIDAPWFLWSVWWNSLLIAITHYIFKDNAFFYIVIFIFSFITPDLYYFELHKYLYPFFVLGFLVNKYGVVSKILNINNALLFVLLLLSSLAITFYDNNIYIYLSGYSIVGSSYIKQTFINLFRMISGLLLSCYFLILLFRLYKSLSKKLISISTIPGKNSIYLYILSVYMNDILLFFTKDLLNFNIFNSLLETLCIILICLIFVFVINKSKIISRIFFGC